MSSADEIPAVLRFRRKPEESPSKDPITGTNTPTDDEAGHGASIDPQQIPSNIDQVVAAVFRGRGAKAANASLHTHSQTPDGHDTGDTPADLVIDSTAPTVTGDTGDTPPVSDDDVGEDAAAAIRKTIADSEQTNPTEDPTSADADSSPPTLDEESDTPTTHSRMPEGMTARVDQNHLARVLVAIKEKDKHPTPLDLDLSEPTTGTEKTKIKWGPAILGGIQASLGIAAYGGAALLAGLRSSVSRLPLVSALGQKNDALQSRDMNWRDTSYDPPSGIMRAFNIAAKVLPTAGSFVLSAGVGFGIKTGLAITLGATPVGLIAVGSAVAGGMLTSLAVGGIKDMIAKRAAYRSDSFDTLSSGRRESRLMKHFKRAAIGAAGGFVGFEFGDEIKEGLTSAFHSVADYAQNVVHAVRETIPSWGWLQDILPGGTETPAPMAVSAPAIPAPPAPVPDYIAPEPIPDEPSAPEQPVVHDQPAQKQPPAPHHTHRPAAPAPTPAPSAPALDIDIETVEVEVRPIRAIEVNGATPRPELMTDPDAAPNPGTGSRPTVQFQATADGGIRIDGRDFPPGAQVQITKDGIQVGGTPADQITAADDTTQPGQETSSGNSDRSHTEHQTASTGHDAYRQVFGYDSV